MIFKKGDQVRIFDTPEVRGEVIEVLADDCRVLLEIDGRSRIQLIDKGLLELVPVVIAK